MSRPNVIYAALLRGINVGGRTAVSMNELKLCFEKLGFRGVRTYINSGNVIFHSDSTDQRAIEIQIEKALTVTFGHEIVVVVRSFDEMGQLIQHIPAGWLTNTDQKCNIIFLRHTIDSPEVIENLNPKKNIEELYYHPGVLFWSAKTSDLTKSNMIKLNQLDVYKEMTIRNLNTTRKVYDLMREANNTKLIST